MTEGRMWSTPIIKEQNKRQGISEKQETTVFGCCFPVPTWTTQIFSLLELTSPCSWTQSESTLSSIFQKRKKKKNTWQPCWKSCTCQANNTWINTHQVLTSCPFREQSQELLRTPPLSSAPILVGREAPVFIEHIWKRGKWSTWEL